MEDREQFICVSDEELAEEERLSKMPIYTVVKITKLVWKVRAESFEEAFDSTFDDNGVEEIEERHDHYILDIEGGVEEKEYTVCGFSTEDIIDRAEQNYYEHGIADDPDAECLEIPTKEQAKAILDIILRTSDMNAGVSWETVDMATEEYFTDQAAEALKDLGKVYDQVKGVVVEAVKEVMPEVSGDLMGNREIASVLQPPAR